MSWPTLAWMFLPLVMASGCAEVKPWERGPLAHRCMRAVPQASRGQLREHVMAVREGASGGLGGAGAGCGCD